MDKKQREGRGQVSKQLQWSAVVEGGEGEV